MPGELAERFREVVETGPDELWASFGLGQDGGRPIAYVSVLHHGPVDAAERDLAPLNALGRPRPARSSRSRT